MVIYKQRPQSGSYKRYESIQDLWPQPTQPWYKVNEYLVTYPYTTASWWNIVQRWTWYQAIPYWWRKDLNNIRNNARVYSDNDMQKTYRNWYNVIGRNDDRWWYSQQYNPYNSWEYPLYTDNNNYMYQVPDSVVYSWDVYWRDTPYYSTWVNTWDNVVRRTWYTRESWKVWAWYIPQYTVEEYRNWRRNNLWTVNYKWWMWKDFSSMKEPTVEDANKIVNTARAWAFKKAVAPIVNTVKKVNQNVGKTVKKAKTSNTKKAK